LDEITATDIEETLKGKTKNIERAILETKAAIDILKKAKVDTAGS